jgi:hypothetical protein
MLLDLSRGVRASPRLGGQLIDAPWVTPAGFSGGLTYDGTGAQYSKAYITISGLVRGQWYELTARLSGLSSGSVNFGWGNGAGTFLEVPQKTYSADGSMRRVQRATSETMTLMVQNNEAGQTFAVSGALVRALSQNLTGLGPDLLVNGGFDADTGWTKGPDATIVDGRCVLSVVNGAYTYVQQAQSFEAGALYVVALRIRGTAGKMVRVVDNQSNIGGLTSAKGTVVLTGSWQSVELSWQANSNSDVIALARSAGGDWSFEVDDVSVRAVPAGVGHLQQASESLRPDLESDVLGFDGIQHSMGVALPGGGPTRGALLIGLKTTDSNAILFRAHTDSFWVGIWRSTETNAATPVYVDGKLFSGSRADLAAKVSDGKPHVLDFLPAAMNGWDELNISAYASRMFEGQIGGICLWDETASGPLTDHHRSILRPLLLGGLA